MSSPISSCVISVVISERGTFVTSWKASVEADVYEDKRFLLNGIDSDRRDELEPACRTGISKGRLILGKFKE